MSDTFILTSNKNYPVIELEWKLSDEDIAKLCRSEKFKWFEEGSGWYAAEPLPYVRVRLRGNTVIIGVYVRRENFEEALRNLRRSVDIVGEVIGKSLSDPKDFWIVMPKKNSSIIEFMVLLALKMCLQGKCPLKDPHYSALLDYILRDYPWTSSQD